MNAPSPGIVAAAIKNEHYDTDLKYLQALGEALRIEYETIVRAGFVLQIDAPDLALERHISFKDKPLSVFLEFVENVVAVINVALKNIPPDRVRLHVCWGNSESPHDSDVPVENICRPCSKRTSGPCSVLRRPAPRAEFRLLRECALKSGQVLMAGVMDPLTDVVEHPEVVSDRSSGWQRRSAIPPPCWPRPIAASTRRRAGAGSRRMWSGQSCAASGTERNWPRRVCSDSPALYRPPPLPLFFPSSYLP